MRAILLLNWTDQGVRNVKESVNRAQQAREAFKPFNVTLDQIYWTLGDHDIVSVVSAPDEESLTAAVLKVTMSGSLRSKTMRAFDESEFKAILGKLG